MEKGLERRHLVRSPDPSRVGVAALRPSSAATGWRPPAQPATRRPRACASSSFVPPPPPGCMSATCSALASSGKTIASSSGASLRPPAASRSYHCRCTSVSSVCPPPHTHIRPTRGGAEGGLRTGQVASCGGMWAAVAMVVVAACYAAQGWGAERRSMSREGGPCTRALKTVPKHSTASAPRHVGHQHAHQRHLNNVT